MTIEAGDSLDFSPTAHCYELNVLKHVLKNVKRHAFFVMFPKHFQVSETLQKWIK